MKTAFEVPDIDGFRPVSADEQLLFLRHDNGSRLAVTGEGASLLQDNPAFRELVFDAATVKPPARAPAAASGYRGVGATTAQVRHPVEVPGITVKVITNPSDSRGAEGQFRTMDTLHGLLELKDIGVQAVAQHVLLTPTPAVGHGKTIFMQRVPAEYVPLLTYLRQHGVGNEAFADEEQKAADNIGARLRAGIPRHARQAGDLTDGNIFVKSQAEQGVDYMLIDQQRRLGLGGILSRWLN